MIRVLQCVASMNKGGIQSFIMNVYRYLDRSQVQFDFLLFNTEKTNDYFPEIIALGGKIHQIPPRNAGIVKTRKALSDFFRNHREYGILHYHLSSFSYIRPLLCAAQFGYPTRILHSHSSHQTGHGIHTVLHRINRALYFQKATHYFACSDKAAAWLYGGSFARSSRTELVCNGIDVQAFGYNERERASVRTEFGLAGKWMIGLVGRFTPPKNHRFLLEVFAEFLKRRPDALLVLIGGGDLEREIRARVAALGLEDAVVFTGFRDDVPRLLNGLDVFAMPSLFEGFPVTLVEAQANGLACVVSDVITSQARITDLTEAVSLDAPLSAWCDALERALNKPRFDRTAEIAHAGFDAKSVARTLQQFYLSESLAAR